MIPAICVLVLSAGLVANSRHVLSLPLKRRIPPIA